MILKAHSNPTAVLHPRRPISEHSNATGKGKKGLIWGTNTPSCSLMLAPASKSRRTSSKFPALIASVNCADARFKSSNGHSRRMNNTNGNLTAVPPVALGLRTAILGFG